MKKGLLAFVAALTIFVSCQSGKKKIPNVSAIPVKIEWKRFDRDFFAIDSNQLENGLNELVKKYPQFLPFYLENLLGLGHEQLEQGLPLFLSLSAPLYQRSDSIFKNTDDLEAQFKKAFQFVKHYFPEYKIPSITTLIGPADLLAESSIGLTPNFLTPETMGVSLQFYLGKDFPMYEDPWFVQNVAPQYRSRRFSKEYIIADAMMLVVDDLFPDNSGGKPLIEQMIERGKQWWLLDKFLPHVPDSIKTGYTQQQLEWCEKFEGNIWATIVENENLYSVTPATLQTYIGESPFTQGMSQEYSPGNLGTWVGWQIVKKYEDRKGMKKIEDIMLASPKDVLDGAAYKPK